MKKGRCLWHLGVRHFVFSHLFEQERVLYAEYQGFEAFEPKSGDAVCMWGGADISPTLYHQKLSKTGGGSTKVPFSDRFQWDLCHYAISLNVPLIGVCRGAQMICALAGGTLFQHVTGHRGGYHPVHTHDGKTIPVSSSHHQMMRPTDVPHILLAYADPRSDVYEVGDDATPVEKKETEKEAEACFFPSIRGLAMQWHPEYAQASAMGAYTRKLVEEFILE